MVDLGALADLGLLDLAEIAHLGIGMQVRARAQPRIGTNGRTFRDMGPFQMREGVDDGARLDRDAGTDDDIRLDQNVLTDLRVEGEEDGFGGNYRNAVHHQFVAAALLPELLDKGEFGTVVAADQLGFRRVDGDGAASERAGDLDDVSQIIFALHIAVANPIQQIQRIAAVDGHQSAVAPGDLAFLVGGILFLADRDQLAILDQKPPVTRGTVGMEADNGDIGTVGNRLARPVERG
ncbi:hypothetical protein D3C72_1544730 [compost metagenome]